MYGDFVMQVDSVVGSGGFSPPRRVAPKKGPKLTEQLYNLRENLGETNNRYLEYPEIAERLHAKLKRNQASKESPEQAPRYSKGSDGLTGISPRKPSTPPDMRFSASGG